MDVEPQSRILMKHKQTIFIALLLTCASCQQGKTEYFYGDMHTYELPEQAETLTGREITFDSVQTGEMFVHDSLLFFVSNILPRHSVYAFNAKTGEYLFGLFPRGQGPLEYRNVSCTPYKRIVNGQTHIYFDATNEQEVIDVNIDKLMAHSDRPDSVRAAITASEFRWAKLHRIPYIPVFSLDEQRILAKTMFEGPYTQTTNPALPQYELIDRETNTITARFPIYTHRVKPRDAESDAPLTENYAYYSADALRPDGKKLALAMQTVPQINILDIETEQMNCFRLKGAPGLDYLNGRSREDLHIYYNNIAAGNKYIYAVFWGSPLAQLTNALETMNKPELHVFDWDGNFIKRLRFNNYIGDICLDEKASLLYAKIYSTDQVFVYSLNQ